jgi:hypothetical protein
LQLPVQLPQPLPVFRIEESRLETTVRNLQSQSHK